MFKIGALILLSKTGTPPDDILVYNYCYII